MSSLSADLLVIGFGKGGKTLAAAMAARGQRVVLVEQSSAMYGGTCINVGCVPTKSMIFRSELPHSDGAADFAAAAARTGELTSELRALNLAGVESQPSATVLTGRARFVDAHTVEVSCDDGVHTVTATNIVVGTGATPTVPDVPGLRQCPVALTSTELLQQDSRPNRVVVIGGGYIGLEFASMLAGYGAAVTILHRRHRILLDEDDDVAETAAALLAERGITVETDADVLRVETFDNTAAVSFAVAGVESTLAADLILVALGRQPDTAALELANAGVAVDRAGAIVVDDHRRTSQPHIFAIGDVTGAAQFTYLSLDDHRIVFDQLTGADPARSAADRTAVPNCLFLTPPLARVGMTEREARATGRAITVASAPVRKLATVSRARIVDEPEGLMKVVVDATTDQILGAALLSYDAHEVINLVALAMRHGIGARTLRDGIYTHPSMSECFNQLLGLLK